MLKPVIFIVGIIHAVFAIYILSHFSYLLLSESPDLAYTTDGTNSFLLISSIAFTLFFGLSYLVYKSKIILSKRQVLLFCVISVLLAVAFIYLYKERNTPC